jgi:hypothetical protein
MEASMNAFSPSEVLRLYGAYQRQRVIDAHYAQAEKADEARAGAQSVRWSIDGPAVGRNDEAAEAARIRTDRIERDTVNH